MVDLVQIGLSVDSRQVDKAAKSLNHLGRESTNTEKATDGLLKKFKAYAGIAAIGKVIWDVIDAHREFQKSISELSAITGATGKDLEFYKNQALALGSSTIFSASQVAEAFKLVASAKPDLLESKEALADVTKQVLTLAEASGLELPMAAQSLGSALNQFQAGADQANRFVNVLAAGAKYGASEIDMTAEALKNVGSVASATGLSFEETNAAIQALAAAGIKGAEAGTGLRGVLLKLASQSRTEFNPQIVGLETAMKNLAAAHLSTADLVKLVGQESITAATALINQAGTIGELTDKLTGTNVAMEQAAINTDNLDGDIKAMKSSWEAVALILGDILDPILRGVVKILVGAGKVIQSLLVLLIDLIDRVKTYIEVAKALATLDFEQAKRELAAREERKAASDERLKQIWGIESAEQQAANDAKKRHDEELKHIEERAKAREIAAQRQKDAALQAEFEAAMRQEEDLNRQGDIDAAKLQEKMDYWDRLYNLQAGSQKAMFDFSTAIQAKDLEGTLRNGALALSNVAKNNKGLFQLQKNLALANAAVTLPSAVLKSFENGGGFPWGLIPAGLMLANGLAQIDAIKNAQFGGGTSIPAAAVGGSTSPSAPVASGLPPGSTAVPGGSEQAGATINVSLTGDNHSTESVRKLMDTIADQIKSNGGYLKDIKVA